MLLPLNPFETNVLHIHTKKPQSAFTFFQMISLFSIFPLFTEENTCSQSHTLSPFNGALKAGYLFTMSFPLEHT